MFISLSDNGGRRVEGDRRQLVLKGAWREKRSGIERRSYTTDRRCEESGEDEKIERRVICTF